jgi:pyrimidine deaminase RibD-like protein
LCKSEPGKVSPKVGAAVARNNRLVAQAIRGELAAGDHAEYTLIEKGCGSFAFDVKSRSFNEIERPINTANARISEDMDDRAR